MTDLERAEQIIQRLEEVRSIHAEDMDEDRDFAVGVALVEAIRSIVSDVRADQHPLSWAAGYDAAVTMLRSKGNRLNDSEWLASVKPNAEGKSRLPQRAGTQSAGGLSA